MAILLRRNGLKWQEVDRFAFPDETHLQRLLHDSPELIPSANADSSVFIREANLPGSGSTDLMGVDADGNILIVETKLARNQEIRRKVIGQILEYGASLWGMSYETFDGLFLAKTQKHLVDLISARTPAVVPELFRSAVSERLNSGQFQLLIAVDEINEELERIIAFMAHMGGVRLEAIELNFYKTDGAEVVVPHRHGQPVTSRTSSTTTEPKLTFEQVLLGFPDDRSRALFTFLSTRWTQEGNHIVPGTKGASFKARIGADLHPIFWAYPNRWGLEPLFGELEKRGAPSEAVLTYRKLIGSLPAFDSTKALNQKFTSAKFENLSEEQAKGFIEASLAVVAAWRSSLEEKN
jgi:hypothetical protein